MFSITKLYKNVSSKFLSFIYAIPTKVCYFLELQLFITILALPIFLSWGLPLSILSPIGNLIFTPWLTTFLTLSSLLFFMQIIGIDNSLIIYLLEKLNQFFFTVLDLADKSFMFSCPCPTTSILFLIPIMLLGVIKLKKSTPIYLRVLILILFSSLLFFSFKYFLAPKQLYEFIANKSKKILLIKQNKKKIIIDNGALAEGRNAKNWVKYKLVPQLLKRGIDHLDYLIIPAPSGKVFESIMELFKNVCINHIYLQEWNGIIPYVGWKCWKTILDLQKQKQVKITYVKRKTTIKLDKNFIININPLEHLMRKNSLKYKKLEITAKSDQNEIPIFDF